MSLEPSLSARLAATLLLGAAFLVLSGLWARDALRRPAVLLCPVLLIVLGAYAFDQPPSALDGPAATLGTLRREPYGLLEHSGGDRPATLLLLSWPLASVLGERAAVAAVTLATLAVTTLLVWALARAVGLEGGPALWAQAVFVVLALTLSGVREGRVAPLVGQAAVALLLVHLARRLDVLEGARDAAAACIFFLLALMADAAGIAALGSFTLILAAGEKVRGDWRRALRLLGAFGIAAALSLSVRYAAGLAPLGRPGGPPPSSTAGVVAVALLALGGIVLARGDPAGLRVLRAAFLTAVVLAAVSLAAVAELERARACYLVVPLAVGVAAAIRPWRSPPRRTPRDLPHSPSAAS